MPTQQQEIEFNELLCRNNLTINSLCLRFSADNAFYFDELRQECTLAIWMEFSRYGIGRFRGDSTESTWIHQISYHAIIHYLSNPKHTEFQSVCDIYNLDQNLDNDDRNDIHLLDDITERLTNRERTMLDHYLKEDSYSTIAKTEAITEANARQRMSRLINKLKMLVHHK